MPPRRIEVNDALTLKLYATSESLDLDAARKLGLLIPFDVILQDPLVAEENPALATDDTFEVRWEPGLADGPTSARFQVLDYDRDKDKTAPAARWDGRRRSFVRGRTALTTRHRDRAEFRQVNLWALLQNALAFYEGPQGLGRPIPWGFEGNRLTVMPHAGFGERAFYDRKSRSLQFFYFGEEDERVYTCLSADIVYHEFAHAVLDGVRPYYSESASIETGAFHEYLGDVSAVLLTLRNNKFRGVIAEQTDGDLSAAKNLSAIAREFGKRTTGRDYLRSAKNRAKLSALAGVQSVHTVSQVLTGAMFDILLALTRRYLERQKAELEAGTRTSAVSPKTAFWNAIERMQRMAVQPLDLLPPVEVTFRDYALAVLRAHQLADPLDPHDYFRMMLDVFVKREILDETDRAELTADRYLHQRESFSVFHDIDSISRSRAGAYRFLNDNREELYIPLTCDLLVADLYDANKYGRTGIRLPRQIVLEYVWRESVALDDPRFGPLQGHAATLLCGGTLVFDERGNVLSWARKPGTDLAEDETRLGWPDRRDSKLKRAWYAEVDAGRARREGFVDGLAARIARGQIGLVGEREPAEAEAGSRPVTAVPREGSLRFHLSPHFGIGPSDT